MINDKPQISLIVPVYNEEKNIIPLFTEIKEVAENTGKTWELIFVDDGSRDESPTKIKEIKKNNKNVIFLSFSKNFGQTAALAAGFDFARGETIITLDADLQNDPHDIPALLEKIQQGYDIVSGWRRKRKDSFLVRRLPSNVANKLISLYTGVHLHDYGCTLKAYRRRFVKELYLFGELHRFIPALMSWSGASISEIEVNHRKRQHGQSKYNLTRAITVLLDLLTVKFILSSTKGPMHVFGKLGFFLVAASCLSAAATIIMKIVNRIDMTGNPILYLTIFLAIMGLQFFAVGLLAEINIRIYNYTGNKKIYHIKEIN